MKWMFEPVVESKKWYFVQASYLIINFSISWDVFREMVPNFEHALSLLNDDDH